jgi:hypothetical protein
MTEKRVLERSYFERFARNGLLPEGTPQYGDKPDVLWHGEQTIGIEITRLYVKSGRLEGSEQRQRPLREAVVRDAQERFRALDTRGIELHVTFDPQNPITSLRRKQLPRELADLARSIDEHQHRQGDFELLERIPEVRSIFWNGKEYSDARWQPSQAHSVEFTPVGELTSAIREKEAKSTEYRPCAAYWLLVVVDWRDPAQEQEIRIDGLKIASSIFEKVFVYKPIFEHVVVVWP